MKFETTEFWESRRGRIVSGRGGWRIGEAIYNCGYSMMDDLVGKKSFFQTLVLNATGKMPPENLAHWIEASFICLSWPDSRIWCNQNGALIGSGGGSPVAAVAAGILTADSRMYGPGSITGGAEFIIRAMQLTQAGLAPLAIVKKELASRQKRPGGKPVIVGYSRPIATGDERVDAMREITQNLGFSEGEHLSLAFKIEKVLTEHYQENMNYVGYVTAFLVDQGFSAKEMYRVYSTWVHSGVHACFAEAHDDVEGGFLPLSCDDIEYVGQSRRDLPDSANARARSG